MNSDSGVRPGAAAGRRSPTVADALPGSAVPGAGNANGAPGAGRDAIGNAAPPASGAADSREPAPRNTVLEALGITPPGPDPEQASLPGAAGPER